MVFYETLRQLLSTQVNVHSGYEEMIQKRMKHMHDNN